MKILIDTNIILDHLLERKPFDKNASKIFAETEKGKLNTFIGATSVTTIFYLTNKILGQRLAHVALQKLLKIFEIAPVNRVVLSSALDLKFNDFEDAVLHEAAFHAGIESIVTRDKNGFRNGSIPVYTTEEFLSSFK